MEDEIKDKVKADYLSGMKRKEICDKYKININTLKSWIKRYKWSGEKKKGAPQVNNKGAPDNIKIPEKDIKDKGTTLTDKQYLFCLYYIKYWNAGKAAKKAGYNCSYKNGYYEIGSQLLKKNQVKVKIDELRNQIKETVQIDTMAVLQKYIDIAFSDITDYVDFGQEKVPVMTAFGPLKDKKTGKIVTEMINTVRFKESTDVDGTIISEVSQGKDEAKIKLQDKMKALNFLAEHIGLLSDKDKTKLHIETEKLKLEKDKFDADQKKENNDNKDININVTLAGDDNADKPDS